VFGDQKLREKKFSFEDLPINVLGVGADATVVGRHVLRPLNVAVCCRTTYSSELVKGQPYTYTTRETSMNLDR